MGLDIGQILGKIGLGLTKGYASSQQQAYERAQELGRIYRENLDRQNQEANAQFYRDIATADRDPEVARQRELVRAATQRQIVEEGLGKYVLPGIRGGILQQPGGPQMVPQMSWPVTVPDMSGAPVLPAPAAALAPEDAAVAWRRQAPPMEGPQLPGRQIQEQAPDLQATAQMGLPEMMAVLGSHPELGFQTGIDPSTGAPRLAGGFRTQADRDAEALAARTKQAQADILEGKTPLAEGGAEWDSAVAQASAAWPQIQDPDIRQAVAQLVSTPPSNPRQSAMQVRNLLVAAGIGKMDAKGQNFVPFSEADLQKMEVAAQGTPRARQATGWEGVRDALGPLVQYIDETEPGKHPTAAGLLDPALPPEEAATVLANFINRWAAINAGRTWKDRLNVAQVTGGANPTVKINWDAIEKADMNDARKQYMVGMLSQGIQRIGISAANAETSRLGYTLREGVATGGVTKPETAAAALIRLHREVAAGTTSFANADQSISRMVQEGRLPESAWYEARQRMGDAHRAWVRKQAEAPQSATGGNRGSADNPEVQIYGR